MTPDPSSEDVLNAISDWLEAKQKEKKTEPTKQQSFGGFGFFNVSGTWPDDGGASDRDDGDEDLMSDVDKKKIQAQLALDLFVARKVEQTLQAIIDANNRPPEPQYKHELYPEQG